MCSRLYTRGVFVSYKRRQSTILHHTALIKIEGVNDKTDVDFYLGKRVAYIYKAQRPQKKMATKGIDGATTKFRVIWGTVQRPHGNNGVVRCGFRKNLPPQALGSYVRVFLYPSRV